MKKIIRLTESDLTRIVRRVIMEQESDPVKCLTEKGYTEVNTNDKGVTTYSKVGKITEVYGTKDKKTWTYYKKNISGVVDQKSVKQNVDPCE